MRSKLTLLACGAGAALWAGCYGDTHVHLEPRERVYVPPPEPVVVERQPDVVIREPAPPRPVYVEQAPPRPVYVREAPPRLIVEKRPAAPDRDSIWIAGYWSHDGHKYFWTAGHYERPPRPGCRYEASVWVRTPNGWEFRAGGWKR